MKKGKLRKFLVAGTMGIMALAMPFAMVGCELEPEEPAIKTNAEAYVMLRDFVEDFKVVNQDKSYETLIEMGRRQDLKFDFDNSDLLPETIDILQSNGMSDTLMNFNRKREYCYNKDNNTGYSVDKVYNYDTLTYDMQSLDVTKKLENDYVNYSCNSSDSNKVASLVDGTYAKNNYYYDKSNIASNSTEMSDVLDNIVKYSTYEAFVENDNNIAEEIISKSSESEIDGSLLNITSSMSYGFDVYTMSFVVSGDDMLISQDEASTTHADVDAIFSISFNENGIICSSAQMEWCQNSEMKSALYSAMLESNNSNVDENSFIKLNVDVGMSFKMDYDASLNDKDLIMNSHYDNFNGKGENGVIENRKTKVTVNFVDVNTKSNITKTFGDTVDLTFEDCRFIDLYAVNIDGVYWDEDCTVAVKSSDKYPSYDSTIYVKVSPKEGYAITQCDMFYDSDDNFRMLGSCRGHFVQSQNIETILGEETYEGKPYRLTKLIINDEEVEIELNSSGNMDIVLEEGKIYLIKAYYSFETM